MVATAIAFHAEESAAASVSQASTITARYNTTCSVGAPGIFDFGTLTSTSSGTWSASANISVNCTANQAFGIWIGMSSNTNPSAPTQRRMFLSPSSYLNYDLSLDGFATLAPTSMTTTGFIAPGTVRGYSISARLVTTGSTITAGSYSDTIIIAVSW